VQLRGDLGRRVVPIDLDPGIEHPEDRTFRRGDLLSYVCEHRPRLVVAALTVLRAFVIAGRPGHRYPVKGSFEAWDRLVRSAIIWAGGADPLGGVQRIRAQADEDLDRLRALLTAWIEQLGVRSLTLTDAIRRAGTPESYMMPSWPTVAPAGPRRG
jgi:putative DNA primase/helicase